jgi:hypothetical protein
MDRTQASLAAIHDPRRGSGRRRGVVGVSAHWGCAGCSSSWAKPPIVSRNRVAQGLRRLLRSACGKPREESAKLSRNERVPLVTIRAAYAPPDAFSTRYRPWFRWTNLHPLVLGTLSISRTEISWRPLPVMDRATAIVLRMEAVSRVETRAVFFETWCTLETREASYSFLVRRSRKLRAALKLLNG